MLQIKEAKAYIKIGINDNEVVKIDWSELKIEKGIEKKVLNYLKQAIKMLKK